MKTNPNKATVRNITVTDSEFDILCAAISLIRDIADSGEERHVIIVPLTNDAYDGICKAGHDLIIQVKDADLDADLAVHCLAAGVQYLGSQYLKHKIKPKSAATPPTNT